MARKSPTNHIITALFSITGKDLAAQLADFSALKKLAWSPDVKIAMQKLPASNIADAVWSELNDIPVSELQTVLASLLAPVKQHQLFDLADWMRDLDSVPEYLQVHWSNHRIPAGLDDLVKKALEVEAAEEAEEAEVTGTKPRKSVAKKGPAGRGKVAKSDMGLNGHEPTGADAQLNGFSIPIKESAIDALKDGKMSDKMRWQRVNTYVKALMPEYGFVFRSSPKRETDDAKKGLSMVTYFIEPKRGADHDIEGLIAHMERTFGDAFDSYEELTSDTPRAFKAWFKHA